MSSRPKNLIELESKHPCLRKQAGWINYILDRDDYSEWECLKEMWKYFKLMRKCMKEDFENEKSNESKA